MRGRTTARALAALGIMAVSGCAGAPASPGAGAAQTAAADSGETSSIATRIGAAPASMAVHLTGSVVTPSGTGLAQLARQLGRQGLTVHWQAGEPLVSLDGSAAAVERVFHVQLARYSQTHGPDFYANVTTPVIPAEVASRISDIVGFNGRPAATQFDTSSGIVQTGYTAADMVGMYDALPLHQKGDTGQGQTIVFLEIDTIASANDLTTYAGENNLPPFNLTVKTNPSWGQAATTNVGESNLDVEIAHAMAPSATLVVYDTDGSASDLLSAAQTAISQHPGAIISESLGACEQLAQADASALIDDEQSLAARAAQSGGSWFVSSGDNGAYSCAPAVSTTDPLFSTASVNIFADPPGITSVGGTTAFLGANQSYGVEAGWGEPLERAGSGGGVSTVEPLPSWQVGPGVDNQYSTGMRQQPDVAGDADPLTGWHVVIGGQDAVVGGTSAAAPMWAGGMALIDQALIQQQRPRAGSTNPALYYFGSHTTVLPSPAFHDITKGDNFIYSTAPGWDYVTGWGTPDFAGLADDWIAYSKSGGT